MPKTLSDIERELAAITAEANAKKKRLRNERVRIQRRENEALGAALRAAGFEGAPDDVAALVSLARAAEKDGEKGDEKPVESKAAKAPEKSAEGAEKAAEKPAESKASETPKPTPAPASEKPNPAPATPASKAEASTSGAVNRLMEHYIKH